MSPFAHASIGLIVKPVVPKAPLWALLLATQVPDLLFFLFEAAGIEYQAVTEVDFSQGLTYISGDMKVWSHGVLMCIVWSLLVTAIALLFRWDRRISAVLGLLVFSHWVLDFIVYPNMPLLFDNSRFVGLGLIMSGPGIWLGIMLEVCLIAGGVAIYLVYRRKQTSWKFK